MNVLDLFSGIGGFSLGLERAGLRTVAFCEIDPYCRKLLAQHWPAVPIFPDVTKLRGSDVGPVDVICGGFPCQDISVAGKQVGLEGARSGLWSEIARLAGELRPEFIIVENVSALLSNGMGRVLGDLAALRYDAEWHCIPASAIGAPHRRDRVWIVAHTQDSAPHIPCISPAGIEPNRGQGDDGYPRSGSLLADASSIGRHEVVSPIKSGAFGKRAAVEIADSRQSGGWGWWVSEPDVGRVADGVPNRTHRIKGLGNAVVPQIPEIIGRAIMRASA